MIQITKSELLKSIQDGYKNFIALLAEWDQEELIRPGAVGKWSVKDTMAHILVHEQRMVYWIARKLSGKCPTIPQPYAMPDPELDILNEQIYQENLDRSFDDILCSLSKMHAQALELVERSKEQDLLDPNRFQLEGGEPLWEAIAANTFWHYEEHGQDVRKWQAAKQVTARS